MINEKVILSDLKRHLVQQFGTAIKDVILFGSRAGGKPQNDSDYDVLVILKKNYSGSDENQILDLCYDIDLKYGILIDLHLLSVKELSSIRGRQSIFVNAIKSGVYI